MRPSCSSRGSGRPTRSKALPVPRLIAIELDRSAPPDLDALRGGARASSSRASRSTITAAGSSRSAPSRAPSRSAASPSCCWSAPPRPPSSSRPPRAPWPPTARSSRCCISSAPPTASSPASSSGISCGWASGPASSARSGRCSCSWPCRRSWSCWAAARVTIAEMRRLIGIARARCRRAISCSASSSLVIAALCMLTSRIGVYRILNSQH